jgi:bacterioferritin-associated ferredoxin
MHEDDEVCLCFHVSLRKIRGFMQRENPPVASLISECLGAGTGCGWCVPFLKHLHREHVAGRVADLGISPEQYVASRLSYRATKVRDERAMLTIEGQRTDAPPGDDQRPEPPSSSK